MAMTALQRRNPAGMESWREWISRLRRRHPIAVPRRFGENESWRALGASQGVEPEDALGGAGRGSPGSSPSRGNNGTKMGPVKQPDVPCRNNL